MNIYTFVYDFSSYIYIYIYILHKNASGNTELVLEAAAHKVAAVRPSTTHHENYQN